MSICDATERFSRSLSRTLELGMILLSLKRSGWRFPFVALRSHVFHQNEENLVNSCCFVDGQNRSSRVFSRKW